MAAMNDRQLASIIEQKLYRAINSEEGEVSWRRQDLFNRYRGQLEGNERDGYSKFVTREVMETVEWALPPLLRIFTGSERVVSFDASNASDEAAAAQETDVVNYVVSRANGGEGFLALYEFIKDALINPTAYAKVYADVEERTHIRKMTGLLADDLARLLSDDTIDLLEQDMRIIQVPLPEGMQEVEVFDIRYRQRDNRPHLRVISVPGEEVLVDHDFTGIDLDQADFVAHRVRKSKSQLLRMGISEEDLAGVAPDTDDGEWNDERVNRMFYEDEDGSEDGYGDPSMRTYWVHEVWMWVDYDGTGIAQYRRILMIGSKIFENEEADYQPMIATCASLIPHRHIGLSLAEMVEDLQRLLTTLTRQLLDNTYKTNTNRKYISEDSLTEDGSTMDSMLDPTSEYVPVRGDPRNAVMPEQPVSVLRDILPVIQHAQAATSMRSGVAPENNVDAGVLQKATYGAFMGAMEKAGERIEMIARIMAETGVKQLFRKAHMLCRMYPDIATTVKLRGEWVRSDPLDWPYRTDMSVNVGLGFNDKRQVVQMLITLLQIQKEALEIGIVQPQNIYNALEKLVDAADIGAVEQFFVSPSSPGFQPPQPPPDPQAQLFAAQAQAVIMEQQRKMQELQVNAQLDAAKLQQDNGLRQVDAMVKLEEVEGKREEREIKGAEFGIRLREMAAAMSQMQAEFQRMGSEIANVDADTGLKRAQAVKAMAAAESAVASADAKEVGTALEVADAFAPEVTVVVAEGDVPRETEEPPDAGRDR